MLRGRVGGRCSVRTGHTTFWQQRTIHGRHVPCTGTTTMGCCRISVRQVRNCAVSKCILILRYTSFTLTRIFLNGRGVTRTMAGQTSMGPSGRDAVAGIGRNGRRMYRCHSVDRHHSQVEYCVVAVLYQTKKKCSV